MSHQPIKHFVFQVVNNICFISFLTLASPLSSFATERIISLKPNVTDILFDLGRGGEVVGVTSWCALPAGVEKPEVVADYMNVDVEKVLLLRPTLVFGSKENSSVREIGFLRERGVKVHLFPFRTIPELLASIREMSKILNVSTKGDELAARIEKGLAEWGKRGGDAVEKRSVLVVVGVKPLVVVGEGNLIDDVVDLFGLRNVVGRSRLMYPNWSVEQMITAKPEIIVDLTMGTDRKVSEKGLLWYAQFPSIPAVREGRIHFLDMADFRASRRILEGAAKLGRVLRETE